MKTQTSSRPQRVVAGLHVSLRCVDMAEGAAGYQTELLTASWGEQHKSKSTNSLVLFTSMSKHSGSKHSKQPDHDAIPSAPLFAP